MSRTIRLGDDVNIVRLRGAIARAVAAERSEVIRLGKQATVYSDRPRAAGHASEADAAQERYDALNAMLIALQEVNT